MAKNTALVAALACAALAFGGKPHAALVLTLRHDSARTLLSLGFASVSLAFDSGHECPNSDGCAGSIL